VYYLETADSVAQLFLHGVNTPQYYEYKGNQMKENEVSRIRFLYKILIGNPEWKQLRWKENIKMYLNLIDEIDSYGLG
jgi:hypothetical protein